MRRSCQDADTQRGWPREDIGRRWPSARPGGGPSGGPPYPHQTWDSSLQSGNSEQLQSPCSDVVRAAPEGPQSCPPPFLPLLPDLSGLLRTGEPGLPGGLCSVALPVGPSLCGTEPGPGPRSCHRRRRGAPPWALPQGDAAVRFGLANGMQAPMAICCLARPQGPCELLPSPRAWSQGPLQRGHCA